MDRHVCRHVPVNGKSASPGADGATAAWRNALATNEPQIKPGPENNNNYHGQHHTRNLTWGPGYITSRARRRSDEKLVRVDGNIIGWIQGMGECVDSGVGPAPVCQLV